MSKGKDFKMKFWLMKINCSEMGTGEARKSKEARELKEDFSHSHKLCAEKFY